jgi:hypothetical protein
MSGNVALGFDSLADAFRDVIEKSEPQFAIGLFGGWGSGKTTLMEAIDRRLNRRDCAVVWFSAWRYEKELHLIVPLLDVIREGLVNWLDANTGAAEAVRQSTKSVAGTIGKVIESLLTGFSLKAGVPGVLEVSYDANKVLTRANQFDAADVAARVPRSFYHASFRALREAFARFTAADPAAGQPPRRIVVFVDDLDRCLPEGALEVLESMKLFFDLPGFVFVVGLDLRVVEASVSRRYRDILAIGEARPRTAGEPIAADVISGAQYVRKIFQVPFTLPPVSADQIQDLVRSIYETANLPASQWTEIDQDVQPHLRFLGDAAGLNPREVKRFINAYTLVRKIKPHLDRGVVVALQTIAFRPDWRPIQFALLAFRNAFIAALQRHAAAPVAGYLEALDPNLVTLPQSFATYIENGHPGHVLIGTTFNIDDYIYSGEAARTSVSTTFLDLFREMGELIGAIRMVRRNTLPRAEFISRVHSALGKLQTSDEAPRAATIVQDLTTLLGLFEQTNTDELQKLLNGTFESQDRARTQLDDLETHAITRVRSAISQLQQLYQAGTI